MNGSGVTNGLNAIFSGKVTEKKSKPKRISPVSIRFSDAEHAELMLWTRGEFLGPYIKGHNLSSVRSKRKPRSTLPPRQQQAIAQALRRLGHSGLYDVLSSLVLAVEEGRLLPEQQMEDDLRQALSNVTALRSDLMTTLGMRADKAGV